MPGASLGGEEGEGKVVPSLPASPTSTGDSRAAGAPISLMRYLSLPPLPFLFLDFLTNQFNSTSPGLIDLLICVSRFTFL